MSICINGMSIIEPISLLKHELHCLAAVGLYASSASMKVGLGVELSYYNHKDLGISRL
jgi:hypothetical protein